MRFIDAGFASGFLYRSENVFGANVPDEFVTCERAATESGECAIEAAAASVIGCEYFCRSVFGPAVEMGTEFNPGDGPAGPVENFADDFRSSAASGVGQRNGFDTNIFQPFESFFDQFRPPRFVVRIAEGHRNVDDQATSGGFGFFVESL